jgi:hypothetical protein
MTSPFGLKLATQDLKRLDRMTSYVMTSLFWQTTATEIYKKFFFEEDKKVLNEENSNANVGTETSFSTGKVKINLDPQGELWIGDGGASSQKLMAPL